MLFTKWPIAFIPKKITTAYSLKSILIGLPNLTSLIQFKTTANNWCVCAYPTKFPTKYTQHLLIDGSLVSLKLRLIDAVRWWCSCSSWCRYCCCCCYAAAAGAAAAVLHDAHRDVWNAMKDGEGRVWEVEWCAKRVVRLTGSLSPVEWIGEGIAVNGCWGFVANRRCSFFKVLTMRLGNKPSAVAPAATTEAKRPTEISCLYLVSSWSFAICCRRYTSSTDLRCRKVSWWCRSGDGRSMSINQAAANNCVNRRSGLIHFICNGKILCECANIFFCWKNLYGCDKNEWVI